MSELSGGIPFINFYLKYGLYREVAKRALFLLKAQLNFFFNHDFINKKQKNINK